MGLDRSLTSTVTAITSDYARRITSGRGGDMADMLDDFLDEKANIIAYTNELFQEGLDCQAIDCQPDSDDEDATIIAIFIGVVGKMAMGDDYDIPDSKEGDKIMDCVDIVHDLEESIDEPQSRRSSRNRSSNNRQNTSSRRSSRLGSRDNGNSRNGRKGRSGSRQQSSSRRNRKEKAEIKPRTLLRDNENKNSGGSSMVKRSSMSNKSTVKEKRSYETQPAVKATRSIKPVKGDVKMDIYSVKQVITLEEFDSLRNNLMSLTSNVKDALMATVITSRILPTGRAFNNDELTVLKDRASECKSMDDVKVFMDVLKVDYQLISLAKHLDSEISKNIEDSLVNRFKIITEKDYPPLTFQEDFSKYKNAITSDDIFGAVSEEIEELIVRTFKDCMLQMEYKSKTINVDEAGEVEYHNLILNNKSRRLAVNTLIRLPNDSEEFEVIGKTIDQMNSIFTEVLMQCAKEIKTSEVLKFELVDGANNTFIITQKGNSASAMDLPYTIEEK